MVASAEVGTLGQADPIAQGNAGKIVNPDIFTQPAVIAAAQPPRKLDPQSRLESTASPQTRTETTE